MASDEEDNDDEEGWGTFDVNDSDDEDNEAPLSEEAQRRQQEERKTWAPHRPKSKARAPDQDPVSAAERRRQRRQRQRLVLQPPPPPSSIESTLSSSSSSRAIVETKRPRSESPVLVDMDEEASSGSDDDDEEDNDDDNSEEDNNEDNDDDKSDDEDNDNGDEDNDNGDDEDNEEGEKKEEAEDEGKTRGDPIYLVYDDITPRALMPTTARDDNKYVRAVNAWVETYQGRDVDATNMIPADISPHDTLIRRIECVPLSQLRTDNLLETFPHLAVPLRTVFVAFVFYDSTSKEAIMDPRSLKSIQLLPLKIIPDLGIEDVLQQFVVTHVTLVLGKEPFRRRQVFSEVAKRMPPAERFVEYPSVYLSLWDRTDTFFFAVDRPELNEKLDEFPRYLEALYEGGLFGEDYAHAPSLLQHMIQLGLLPERRTKRRNDDVEVDASGGAWTHFLARGLYDPRLFLHISEFLTDKRLVGHQNANIVRAMDQRELEPFYDPQRDRFVRIFNMPDDLF